ncbi:MAG: EAL domain-containing protein [Sporosarcina sp.]
MRRLSKFFIKPPPSSNNNEEFTPQDEVLSELAIKMRSAKKLIDFGLWKYDVGEDKSYWSDKVFEIFDMQKGEAPTIADLFDIIHPEDLERFKTLFAGALKEKTGSRISFRIIDKKGEVRFLEQYCEAVLDENENLLHFIGTTIDVSEIKRTQQNFKQYVKKAEEITEFLDAGIWTIDVRQQKMVFCSPRIEDISGYKSIDFETDKTIWRSIIYHEDLAKYDERNEKLKLGKVPKLNYRIVQKGGSIRWIRDEVVPTYTEGGELVRLEGIITDITEQREVQEQLEYLAYHDYLTKLPNRRMFDKELNAMFENVGLSDTPFSIMHLGLDGFKLINDSLGHLAGDILLKEFSLRVKACITSHDFVARIDGDEFAILIRNAKDVAQVIDIAKKMIDTLEEPYVIDNHELYVTASIGISLYPEDGDNATTLLGSADKALYRAKERGKNNYQLYMPSMNVEAYKLYSLDQDLRKAIERKELVVYYQPKVEAKTGLMVGAEALIRWNHPEWKLVSAGEFISLAEENGLIYAITNWVFRTVCEQINKWKEIGAVPVPVSVNISPKIFLKHGWEDQLIKVIEETNIDPKLLELEITESNLIENEETFKTAINKLKSYGIKLSIDDFGTGFSSLLYLQKFEIDTIKIDRHFINHYLVDNNAPITKAIIRLAHELNMTVVAEGVETEEQRVFLSQQNCDQIQGYLFSKPIPPEQFIGFLHDPVIRSAGKEAGIPIENRRKGFRIDLAYPLNAEMTIVQFKGKTVKLGKTEVLVEDIGIGGLRFMSHVDLPVNPNILLEFTTEILGELVEVKGNVVWREVVGEFFQYGLQFQVSENEQQLLTKLLNNFAIQIRKNPVPPNCRFVKEGIFKHLTSIKGE